MGTEALRTLTVLLLLAMPALAAPALPRVSRQVCSVESLVANLREGLKTGSPALQTYLLAQLELASVDLPAAELRAAVLGERDPAVLAAMGAALATKASSTEDPTLIQPLLSRTSDSDPALRAAAVRGLKGKGSVELMEQNGNAVSYERLIRDESPEVRRAVVENLIAEDKEVYSGHSAEFSAAAVRTALGAKDPSSQAELLGSLSTSNLGSEGVRNLLPLLKSPDVGVRTATARALGAIGPAEVSSASDALLWVCKNDAELAVRKAALESLVRLQRTGSIPLLKSLASSVPALSKDIEAWMSVLGLGLQEWPLISREKQRRWP